jgi:hypothetical protein
VLIFQRNGGRWTRSNYMKLVEKKEEGQFLLEREKLNSDIMLIRKGGICLDLIVLS